MPLHRDIHWVGRQWAVTGSGMQAVDQRLKGEFDIEISRLWEDDLAERMYLLKWVNIADFEKGLGVARKRYPQPPRKAAPPEKSAPPPKESAPIEPPKPAAETFDMRLEGSPAKFVAAWRIRRQR